MLMGAGECMIELLRKGINVVRRIGWRSEANFKNICNHIPCLILSCFNIQSVMTKQGGWKVLSHVLADK